MSAIQKKPKNLLVFSLCDVGATWPGPASTISSNLCLTPVSTTFSHIGRILVVDQSRPVPPVPPCPADEVGNSHSFHPQGRREVSHLVCSSVCITVLMSVLGVSIEQGHVFISVVLTFCLVFWDDVVFMWWPN